MADSLDATLPPTHVALRLGRLRKRLVAEGLEALLVTKLENLRYLTGFSGSAAMLLVTGDDALLTTDGRYRDQSAEELHRVGVEAEIYIDRLGGQFSALESAAKRLGYVGLEAEHCSWARQAQFAELFSAELVATRGYVETLRRVKDVGEVARIERACAVADVALAQVKQRLTERCSEEEFAAELDFEMRRRGASAPAFQTIVASGPNGALPHARPTARPIEEGELVVIDFGATIDGYCSDMTRTLCVGEPEPELRELIEAVQAAQRAGVRALKPGVAAAAVDAACRDLLDDAGYGELFLHSTGHGVGLEIHEAPAVAAGSTDSLALGNVVTVEPGAYLAGRGGVRIEDTLVVTKTGAKVLTRSTKDYTL